MATTTTTSPEASPSHIIIVGGVAAGATAAARIRRLSEQVKITLLEKSPYVSYANCGLPYYIGGDIKVSARPSFTTCVASLPFSTPPSQRRLPTYYPRQDRDRLFVQTPEGFRKRYNVDVRVNAAALDCDPKGKRLLVRVRVWAGNPIDLDGMALNNLDRCLIISPHAPPFIGRGRLRGVAQL